MRSAPIALLADERKLLLKAKDNNVSRGVAPCTTFESYISVVSWWGVDRDGEKVAFAAEMIGIKVSIESTLLSNVIHTYIHIDLHILYRFALSTRHRDLRI